MHPEFELALEFELPLAFWRVVALFLILILTLGLILTLALILIRLIILPTVRAAVILVSLLWIISASGERHPRENDNMPEWLRW